MRREGLRSRKVFKGRGNRRPRPEPKQTKPERERREARDSMASYGRLTAFSQSRQEAEGSPPRRGG